MINERKLVLLNYLCDSGIMHLDYSILTLFLIDYLLTLVRNAVINVSSVFVQGFVLALFLSNISIKRFIYNFNFLVAISS